MSEGPPLPPHLEHARSVGGRVRATGSTPTVAGVGARHHWVPRFYLARWAVGQKQLVVRSASGRISRRNVSDLGWRDFYTASDAAGESDGRLEQMLGVIEERGSIVISRLMNPLLRELPTEDYFDLALYVSFQLVRTRRSRREFELIHEHLFRERVEKEVSSRRRKDKRTRSKLERANELLKDVALRPHPNYAYNQMLSTQKTIFPFVALRQVTVVTIDRPLLLTCDEPVLIEPEQHRFVRVPRPQPLPQDRAARRRRLREMGGHTVERLYGTGLSEAPSLTLPLSPRHAAVWGSLDAPVEPVASLSDSWADIFAESVNNSIARNAFEEIYCHPDHEQVVRRLQWAPPTALIDFGGVTAAPPQADAGAPRLPTRYSRATRLSEPGTNGPQRSIRTAR